MGEKVFYFGSDTSAGPSGDFTAFGIHPVTSGNHLLNLIKNRLVDNPGIIVVDRFLRLNFSRLCIRQRWRPFTKYFPVAERI
jgi:hypothetical protein